ncbi:hypothetical protein AURDEDRAFT_140764 [Auricularia subglabra TFB-10046 SS5]|nr:hypothetical protein AURDEDRAFT_140764 [Auricularia subglabra TFB-10046 SS5]
MNYTGMPAVFVAASNPPLGVPEPPREGFTGSWSPERRRKVYHVSDDQWTLWPEKSDYPPPFVWDAMGAQRIARSLGSMALKCFQDVDGDMLERLINFAAARNRDDGSGEEHGPGARVSSNEYYEGSSGATIDSRSSVDIHQDGTRDRLSQRGSALLLTIMLIASRYQAAESRSEASGSDYEFNF